MSYNGYDTRWKKGLYRSRSGAFLGVCKGLSEYLDFPLVWMRVLWLVGVVFLFGFPMLLAYFVLAIVMKPEPVVPFRTEAEREFYDSYASSRSMAIHRLKRTFDTLNHRIERMESIVTSKDYDWDRRFSESE
ncbi:MAG: envelope stress response membrane protein PspC [Candidatus Sumerlaeia bacterium]